VESPAPKLSGRRLLLYLLGLLALAVVPAVVLPTLVCRPEPPKLDDLGVVPPLAFTDNLGSPATADIFAGHVTIVSFIFTRCEAICPVTAMKMERIQEQTKDAGDRIKLVSFSIDPAYDTPARLAEYAARFKADPARWRYLTGPVEEMRAIVEGPFVTSMMAVGTTAGGAPDIAHSGHFFLVDKHGHIRGTYASSDVPRLETLMRHARYLARL
jgi:protein SCO1/2